jgi:hypothetical protein
MTTPEEEEYSLNDRPQGDMDTVGKNGHMRHISFGRYIILCF